MIACCVGQAGNQIGAATARRTGPVSHLELAAEALDHESTASTSSASYAGGGRPAVSARVKPSGFAFIDSEPKVVRGIVTPPATATASISSTFLPFVSLNGSVAWDQNGRGNNWAWGYTGLAGGARPGSKFATVPGAESSSAGGKKGKNAGSGPLFASSKTPLWKRAMETIRKQAEACELLEDDRGGGGDARHDEDFGDNDDDSGGSGAAVNARGRTLLLTHSLGGGTGAGLGSRLLEACRDEFPKWTLLSAVVAPFACGDTPLQHYNTALALASCQEVSDAVLLFNNDDLVARAKAKQGFFQYHYQSALQMGGGAGAVKGAAGGGRARFLAAGGSGAASVSGGASSGPGVVSTWDCNETMAEALSGLISPVFHRRRGRNQSGTASGGATTGPASSLHSRGWVDVSRIKRLVGNKGADSESKLQYDEEPDDQDQDHKQDEDESGEDDDRDGWIRDSVRAGGSRLAKTTPVSAATARAGSRQQGVTFASEADEGKERGERVDDYDEGDGEGEFDGSSATVFPHYFCGRVLLRQLGVGGPSHSSALGGADDAFSLPSSCCKYLDLRSATNVFLPPSSASSSSSSSASPSSSPLVLPGVSWADLADSLSDTLPRYLASSSASAAGARGANRHVTTFAARLIARGATQRDCDSVDPTLPSTSASAASASSPGGSPSHGWGEGLPATLEWATVGQKLSRALNVPGSGGSYSTLHHRSHHRQSAANPFGTLLSAALSPSLLGSPVCRKSAAYGDLIRRTATATQYSTALSSLNARSLTLAVHSDAFTTHLLHTVERVENLLRLRAYLHWYERFGVGSDHVRAAAETLLDAVDAYTTAASDFQARAQQQQHQHHHHQQGRMPSGLGAGSRRY